jgi:acetyltransferase-like isoleucine patch superfamily enzyme
LCSNVEVGEDCFIAHGVMFINDDFKNYKVNYPEHLWKKTEIANNVVIGSNATILPVKIGKNSIIGAGAVVLTDIPEDSVVVGNPGKIIKKEKCLR